MPPPARPVVFLDTETTSLDPDRRRPWEIAIIRRDDAGETVTLIQVSDVDLTDASPASLVVGRFHTRHAPTAGTDPAEPCRVMVEADAAALVDDLTAGATIVGAVPSFDTGTLAAMLARHGRTPAWHHRLRCVETLTAGHLRRDPGGLADAAAALGIPVDPAEWHTALGDARTALRIWDRVMGAAGPWPTSVERVITGTPAAGPAGGMMHHQPIRGLGDPPPPRVIIGPARPMTADPIRPGTFTPAPDRTVEHRPGT